WGRTPNLKKAVDFLETLPSTSGGPTYDDLAQRQGLVYVASDGSMRYQPRFRRKPFPNDLSEKIWVAWATLNEVGCRSAFATIATVLNAQTPTAPIGHPRL